MRVVLLAGGMGTRLQEETRLRPKPMVEVGDKPILWHIMMYYHGFGHKDFYVACGYMGNFIKSYFLDQYHLSGNLKIDFSRGTVEREQDVQQDWTVNLIDTGLHTMTGGRLLRLQPWLKGDTFLLTYGDGVSNIDLDALLKFHRRSGRLVTVSAVRPPARFGGLTIDNGQVASFSEKPSTGEGWINGGFMAMEPGVFDYLTDETCSLECDALERIASDGQLAAYCHEGFWQCMDTLRDKQLLEKLWSQGEAPWKNWGVPRQQSLLHPAAQRAA